MNLFQLSIISGFSLASLHICWAVLVAIGWAQSVIDFIFKLHMLSSPFQVQPFEFSLAMGLVCVIFLVGCFYGVVFFIFKKYFQNNRQIYSSIPPNQ